LVVLSRKKVTLYYAHGSPKIHKIFHRIWFTINIESKENVGTGMLTEEEERKKKKKQ